MIDTESQKISIFRRLAALLYDALIVCALLMLMTWLALLVNHGRSFGPNNVYFTSYLILCTGLFQSWFWHRSGQTLGMLAWGLRLKTTDNKPLTLKQAFVRFLISVPCLWFFGLGFWWSLIESNKQCLQDKLAGTKIVRTLAKPI